MVSASPHQIQRDPVCGMTVGTEAKERSHSHNGEVFHFCSSSCQAKFTAGPDPFIEAKDLVCGMTVQRKSAKQMAKHVGESFYFC